VSLKSSAMVVCLLLVATAAASAPASQSPDIEVPPTVEPRIYDIVDAVSADQIEEYITRLVSFGTRNTFSDTESDTRGIGAARRWIHSEFAEISAACGDCLEVSFHRTMLESRRRMVTPEMSGRIPEPVNVVNVVGVIRGTVHPNRYVIMSGDIDSRVSDTYDFTSDAPGANDNASGMAGTMEAARVLSQYRFPSSVAFVGLSGEEQGLFGGRFLAETAAEEGWDIGAVLNNDMIGNIEGIDGVIENDTFRVFSQPRPVEDVETWDLRRLGGEADGPSRQLARYVHRITDLYIPNLDAIMIYRLDRFGRGGHHTPFNNAGFPAVRIMETHENYIWQHQDLRTEDGIEYGDTLEHVDFDHAANLTSVNAATLAALGWAPPTPDNVRIGGAVQPDTTLAWDPVESEGLAGYKIYWRETTAPQWTDFRYVGDVTEYTLEGLVIDNYLFGVAAVGQDGNESVVSFPTSVLRRR